MSEIGIFEISFLKVYKSIAIENFKPVSLCPINWRPFKTFVKVHKSPLLTGNS